VAQREDNPLLISVGRLPEDGLSFSHDLAREWLCNIPEFSDDDGPHVEGPVRVSGRVGLEGTNLRLKGRVEATLHASCSRCGKDAEHRIESDFDLALIKGPAPEPLREMELSPEELEHNYYDGDEVDLSPFFQEEVALAAPFQTLCSEGCKGLCPTCGANKNQGECDCEEESGDPRLEALRNLKIDK